MTGVEAQRREELAILMHRHWTLAVRTVLTAIEPLIRNVPRGAAHRGAWQEFDRLLLLSSKKFECLKGDECVLALAQADETVKLLRELGELP